MALVGALSPLGKVASRRVSWAAGVSIYTVAGVLASSAVGMVIGFVGQGVPTPLVLAVVAGASGGAAVMGLLSFRIPVPELSRQTDSRWASRFPRPLAALLWGIDLGLVFTTHINLVGTWMLALVALAAGPWLAGALFASHWVGRALSVWLAPDMMRHAADGPALIDQIHSHREHLVRAHTAGLGWMALVTFLWLAQASGG